MRSLDEYSYSPKLSISICVGAADCWAMHYCTRTSSPAAGVCVVSGTLPPTGSPSNQLVLKHRRRDGSGEVWQYMVNTRNDYTTANKLTSEVVRN